MLDTTIGTTTLIEIRDFLRRAEHAAEPWSTPNDTVDRLYDTLRRHRDDDRFWSDLRELTERLEDRRFVPAAIPGGEALGPAVTERLLRELRASLPPVNGSPHPIVEWLGSRASAVALTGFLLLGAAVGCTEDGEQCRSTAEAHGMDGEEATVYEALVGYVDATDFTHGEKCTIYECLPEVDSVSREYLLESFQTASDAELATQLETLLDYCEEILDDEDEDDDDWDCDDGCH